MIDAMQVSISMIDGRLLEGRDFAAVAAAAEVLLLLLLVLLPLSFLFASRSSCCFFS